MKVTKIVVITLVIAVAIGGAVTVFAGGKRGHGRFGFMGPKMFNAENIIARFKEPLELTEEQEAQLKPIVEEALEKGKTTFQKYRGETKKDWGNARTEAQELWQETEAKLAEVLTAEQMQKVQQMHADRLGRFGAMGFGGRGPGGRFHQLLEDLNLSDQQKQELFSIFMEHRETKQDGMKTFLGTHKEIVDLLLTEEFDEQKVRAVFQQQSPEWEDMFVEHAKTFSEMKAVLTPEQVETLQQKAEEFFEHVENWQGKGPGRHGWFHK
jgi:Spy/CpxP family protein refolding chaperone